MIGEQRLTSCLSCGLRPWPSVHFALEIWLLMLCLNSMGIESV